MAGETRRQRRDARRAAGDQGGGDSATSPSNRRSADSASGESGGFDGSAASSGTLAAPSLGQPSGHRHFSFFREVWGELRKVEWPNRAQVIQGTVVVLLACTIVGAFLYACDLVLRPFVQHVLLGQ